MRYFAEIENEYIIGQGASPYGIIPGSTEITKERFDEIIAAQDRCPGPDYKLTADTLEWVRI